MMTQIRGAGRGYKKIFQKLNFLIKCNSNCTHITSFCQILANYNQTEDSLDRLIGYRYVRDCGAT